MNSHGRGGGPAESSEDALLGGRVRLLQPKDGYRVAIDPVFLAAALEPAAGLRVLDLGCGVGAAALCLLRRCPENSVVGLELQDQLAQLAEANSRLNELTDRFSVCHGDLRQADALLGRADFDQVMVNPPYQAAGTGRASRQPARALANHEGDLPLESWLDAALGQLRPKGTLTLIHRADRLPELLAGLAGRAGRTRVLPLWPASDKPAKRVLVAAQKGVRGPAALLPGLVIHDAAGRYTAAAQAVLRDAGRLDW